MINNTANINSTKKYTLEDDRIMSIFIKSLKSLQKQQINKKKNNRKLLNLFSVKVGYNDYNVLSSSNNEFSNEAKNLGLVKRKKTISNYKNKTMKNFKNTKDNQKQDLKLTFNLNKTNKNIVLNNNSNKNESAISKNDVNNLINKKVSNLNNLSVSYFSYNSDSSIYTTKAKDLNKLNLNDKIKHERIKALKHKFITKKNINKKFVNDDNNCLRNYKQKDFNAKIFNNTQSYDMDSNLINKSMEYYSCSEGRIYSLNNNNNCEKNIAKVENKNVEFSKNIELIKDNNLYDYKSLDLNILFNSNNDCNSTENKIKLNNDNRFNLLKYNNANISENNNLFNENNIKKYNKIKSLDYNITLKESVNKNCTPSKYNKNDNLTTKKLEPDTTTNSNYILFNKGYIKDNNNHNKVKNIEKSSIININSNNNDITNYKSNPTTTKSADALKLNIKKNLLSILTLTSNPQTPQVEGSSILQNNGNSSFISSMDINSNYNLSTNILNKILLLKDLNENKDLIIYDNKKFEYNSISEEFDDQYNSDYLVNKDLNNVSNKAEYNFLYSLDKKNRIFYLKNSKVISELTSLIQSQIESKINTNNNISFNQSIISYSPKNTKYKNVNTLINHTEIVEKLNEVKQMRENTNNIYHKSNSNSNNNNNIKYNNNK